MPNKDVSPLPTGNREDDLLTLSAEVLETLLRDHTTGRNIFWATHDYEALGPAYGYHSEIRPEQITGVNRMVIMPRVQKSKQNQTDRSKDMAEVFTPSWICDAQNNLVDEAWRAEKSGTWEDYVRQTCLEITRGEAPYLVSRYDTTTGDTIPMSKRVGLLDRKIHLINEHVSSHGDWLRWVLVAYQHTYGYEWQGDNLLLARLNLLSSFIEYHRDRFGQEPAAETVREVADIVAWNLWQMDGLKGGIPGYEPTEELGNSMFGSFFPPAPEERYCRIYDWEKKEEIRYIDLIDRSL